MADPTPDNPLDRLATGEKRNAMTSMRPDLALPEELLELLPAWSTQWMKHISLPSPPHVQGARRLQNIQIETLGPRLTFPGRPGS